MSPQSNKRPPTKRRNQPTASSPLVREQLARRKRWMIVGIVVGVAVVVAIGVGWWVLSH
ncbi:MAG: hypothetical protein KC431_28705 [Myxococcales bacterium]|nr:hypothetical protein [Myxococcales bacterium]